MKQKYIVFYKTEDEYILFIYCQYIQTIYFFHISAHDFWILHPGLSYFTVKNDFYNLTCKLRIFTCKIVKNVLKSFVDQYRAALILTMPCATSFVLMFSGPKVPHYHFQILSHPYNLFQCVFPSLLHY